MSTTPRTDAASKDRPLCVPVEFARQLETELNALQEDRDKWKANHDNQVNLRRALMDRPDLKERAKLVTELEKERNQLLATIEGLRDAVTYFCNYKLLYDEYENCIIPRKDRLLILEKFANTLQSLPPTNLVKRSVLEEAYQIIKDDCIVRFDSQIQRIKKFLEEAHEELERTKQV